MNGEKDTQFNNFQISSDSEEPKHSRFDESQMKEIDNPYQRDTAEGGEREGEASTEQEKTADEAQSTDEKKLAYVYAPSTFSEVIRTIIAVIAGIALLVSGFYIFRHYYDSGKNKKDAQTLAEFINAQESNTAINEEGIFEKYSTLYEANSDFVGWIRVPNTNINHPVVRAKDNAFYLHRGFDKKYNIRGTIFMDYRDHIDVLCKNTILYGHNNLDSTMFSDLEKYTDIEFYKQNPVIEFNTIDRNYKWKIISVFYTNADDKDDNGYSLNYIYPFMTDDNFESYYQELLKRSLFFTTVNTQKTDKILTLSTCTREMDIKGQGETNARFVVVARMVREGEDETVQTQQAIPNPNPKYPQIWYDAHGQQNPFKYDARWYPEGAEY